MTHENRKLQMIKNIIEGKPVAYKITGNSLGIHGNESGAIFEEYEDLVEYFKIYGKILVSELFAVTIVSWDYSDVQQICEDNYCWNVNYEDSENTDDFIELLNLRKKAEEGEEAKKRLEETRKPTKLNEF